MPTTIWNNGKVYNRSEDVVADILNREYSDRLQWQLERNISIVQIRGVSDYQSPSGGSELIPQMVAPIFVEKEGSSLRVDLHAQVTTLNTNDTDAGFFYIHLDSYSDVIKLGTFSHVNNTYWNNVKLTHTLPRLGRGLYTLRLGISMDVGYVQINYTNTLAEFRVEEIGVRDYIYLGDSYYGRG